jgi:hypothetical protein
MNKATKHRRKPPNSWPGSLQEGAASRQYLPTRFYPLIDAPSPQRSPRERHAGPNKGRGLDVRLLEPRPLDGDPSGYNLTCTFRSKHEAHQTPEAAADAMPKAWPSVQAH